MFKNEWILKRNLSSIKLRKFSLTLLSDGIDQQNFHFLTLLIKQFSSSLTYLSLDFHKIKARGLKFDGLMLQQQLLEPMIHLKSFHLYIQLAEKLMNVEHFLSTFETQFWFDHQWTLGMHETKVLHGYEF